MSEETVVPHFTELGVHFLARFACTIICTAIFKSVVPPNTIAENNCL